MGQDHRVQIVGRLGNSPRVLGKTILLLGLDFFFYQEDGMSCGELQGLIKPVFKNFSRHSRRGAVETNPTRNMRLRV